MEAETGSRRSARERARAEGYRAWHDKNSAGGVFSSADAVSTLWEQGIRDLLSHDPAWERGRVLCGRCVVAWPCEERVALVGYLLDER